MGGLATAGEVRRLPVRLQPAPDEALDSYLERHAAANHLDAPVLLRRVAGDLAHLPIAPTREVVDRVAALTGQDPAVLRRHSLAAHAGVAAADDVTGDSGAGWRHTGRMWAPGRGTQLCPACLATDGAWRVTWRHPWVTICLVHHTWLVATCPTCERPFRMNRSSPLRSVDAADGTCGNPVGARGRTCSQDLCALEPQIATAEVLASQERIGAAIHHQPVRVLGGPMAGAAYLEEIRVLAVLLLHLACQDQAKALAPWADAARHDRRRSAAGRGARWGLAPPVEPVLRGQVLTAADKILAVANVEEAAERLGPWLELTPLVPEGQLGWLADHTVMTPLLTRLVMAATSTRRRISTLLVQESSIDLRWIPQRIPSELYAVHLAGLLDVTDATGRLFASLCLSRLGRPGTTWGAAAATLGMPAETGPKTARACSADILCSAPAFIDAIVAIAREVDEVTDYRDREAVVRRLAGRRRWYTTWARMHCAATRATSKRYAIAWLWTTYAGGHLDTSPGWTAPPTAGERARYRRYAARLDADAQHALVAVTVTAAATRITMKGNAHGTAR